MKKDIEWLKSAIQMNLDFYNDKDEEWQMAKVRAYAKVLDLINQLDEPEVLSKEWISENVEYAYFDMLDGSGRLSSATAIIKPKKLKNLLVPKQEEVDRAYKSGYETGKQHTFYKGYLEGLTEGERKTNEYFESITEEPSYEQVQKYLSEHGIEVVEKEPETVADVIADFFKSLERLKEVMRTQVEELEE